MTKELSNKFDFIYKDSVGDYSYLILNENAYNYRNSRVVVHYWHKAEREFYPELLYLNDIYEAKPVEAKCRCYDGSSPFDEKEIEMTLDRNTINKVYINGETYNLSNSLTMIKEASTALSNVAEAAKTANDSFNTLSTVLNNKYSTPNAPLIRFDSTGITISNDAELNLNYEKFNEKLEEAKLEKNRKESKKMFENVIKNFDFGKCGEDVKMSVYGPAFRDYEGNYIAFNGDEAIDVTGMTFNFDCCYKMPVAQDDVEIGDYIYHLNDPVKVIDVTERGSLVCVRLFSHTEVTVVPIKNMFGFNFFTKLVNFGEGIFGANTIDKSNPFGSMLPLFLMSKGGKNDNLMMAMMMSQGNLDFKSNPFMLMALMGDSKDRNDAILPLMMSQMLMPKHECKCGGKCSTPNPID